MGWKSFNDRLALLIVAGVPITWIVNARWKLNIDPAALGTLTGGWLLVLQYYFRKRGDSDSPNIGQKPKSP